MSFKNLPSWIKGGLIGVVIFLLICSILFILDYRCIAPLLKDCPSKYSITGNETDLFETVRCSSNAFNSCKSLSDIVYYLGIFPIIFLIKIIGFDPVSFGSTVFMDAIIYDVFIFLDVIITGFILGSLIGWIYEKIKKINK